MKNDVLNAFVALIYDPCGFVLSNLKWNTESKEYGACTFDLNEKKIQHRVSKITPTKTGQFVAIWKRNNEGITIPYDVSDTFDYIVISSVSGNNLGQFIFPKYVLEEKGIISRNGKGGKRGIRVYPPWDSTTNDQAKKTQNWQSNYFLLIQKDASTNLQMVKQMFSITD